MAFLPALLVLCAASGVLGSSYPTEVVELTDDNFEHDTQAASGQTTGVWAVLFTDSTLKRHERAVQVLRQLAEDEEKELIYAQVDVAQSVKVARRFGDVILPPCILLFRNRQMYLFDQSFDRGDVAEEIRHFVTSGYSLASPLDVPEHRVRQLNMEAFESSRQVDYKTVGIAVLMIVGGLLFQTWAVMNKDKFRPEPGTPEAAAAAAAAKAAAEAKKAAAEAKKAGQAAAEPASPPPAAGKGGAKKAKAT